MEELGPVAAREGSVEVGEVAEDMVARLLRLSAIAGADGEGRRVGGCHNAEAGREKES